MTPRWEQADARADPDVDVGYLVGARVVPQARVLLE